MLKEVMQISRQEESKERQLNEGQPGGGRQLPPVDVGGSSAKRRKNRLKQQ